MLTISDKSVFISAKENRGIDGLLKLICEMLSGGRRQMELLVPYRDMPFLDRIRKTGKFYRRSIPRMGSGSAPM